MTNRNAQSTVATSNHTTNYDLPLWSGEDITTWQGNLNDAFNKIDTAMYENKNLMLGYQEIADRLQATNDSTVELVNQVNEQLTEINVNYQEVKDSLVAANQKITEAEQAIINLQHEDDSVKVQMDTMQDDIGKLMEWYVGTIATTNVPITSQQYPGIKIIGAAINSSCILFVVDMDMEGVPEGSGMATFSTRDVVLLLDELNLPTPVYSILNSGWIYSDNGEHYRLELHNTGNGDDNITISWTGNKAYNGVFCSYLIFKER